jgi:hypothetical protein
MHLEELYASFLAAEIGAGSVSRTYHLTGRCVRLRFAGEALVSLLTPALAHLETEDRRNPDVTVCCWDTATTGVQVPEALLSLVGWMYQGRSGLFGRPETSEDAQRIGRSVSAFDMNRNLAVQWFPSPESVTAQDRAAPLLVLLNVLLSTPGTHLMHAGAVGQSGVGVLLVGRGGSGKSTTALACLEEGLTFVGDDYVAIEAVPEPRVWSLYAGAKVHADSLGLLPSLRECVVNAEEIGREKLVLSLHPARRPSLGETLRLGAVIVPRVVPGAHTRLTPLAPPRALLAAGPSTVLQLPQIGPGALPLLAAIIRRVPCFRLEIGRESPVPAILGLLNRLREEAAAP